MLKNIYKRCFSYTLNIRKNMTKAAVLLEISSILKLTRDTQTSHTKIEKKVVN